MLDPSLDLDDSLIATLLNLKRHDEVVEFYDCSLANWDELPNVRRLTITERPGFGGELEWQASKENSWHAVRLGDIATFAPKLFGNVAHVTPLECAIAAQTGSSIGCDVFLTTNQALLETPLLPWWKCRIGPISPGQLSGILSVMFRRAGFLPTSTNSTASGGAYDCAIQRFLPSYLRLYRWLCTTGDHDGALHYLDGLLGNCAQALMALDRLACVHFDEDMVPASNVSVAQQQYEAASFVVAATAALEGLTWVLLGMSGLEPDRRRVTFRKLLRVPRSKQDIEWVEALSCRFPHAIEQLRDGFGNCLEVTLHFRDLLQHHVPIPVAVAEFRDVSIIINGQPRFSDKHQVGVLLVEPHPGERLPALASDSGSGVLPEAVMPYPFLRSCASELYVLIDAVLAELARESGAPDNISTSLWYEDGFLTVDDEMVCALTQRP